MYSAVTCTLDGIRLIGVAPAAGLDGRRSIDVIDRPGQQHLEAADGFCLLLTFNPGHGPGLSEPVRNRMALIVDVPTDFDTARGKAALLNVGSV